MPSPGFLIPVADIINSDIMCGSNLTAEIPVIDLVRCTSSILVWAGCEIRPSSS